MRSARLFWVPGVVAGLLLGGVIGCDSPTPPVIATVSPGVNATDVSVFSVISVSFSVDMDASTINLGTFFLTDESGATVGATLRNNARGATLAPAAKLVSGARYTVHVSGHVQSEEGAEFGDDYSYSFTTAPAGNNTDSITFVSPSDFTQGRATVTLSHLSPTEGVLVIPVHGSQATTQAFSTDGFDYWITASGVLGDTGTLGSPALAQNQTSPKKRLPLRRHPKNFKKRWESVNLLTRDDKNAANTRRASLKRPAPTQQPASATFGKCVGPYALGQQCTFQVIDYNDNFVAVPSTLKSVSTNALFFVDNNDLGDFSAAELAQLGASLDNVAVPTDRQYFGEFPDTDENTKIIVVLSRVLIDPVNKTGAFGYVAPWDMYPDGTITNTPSNEGDIFYAATPARVQALGYARADYFNEVMPETMVHELKHLVAIGTRLLSNRDVEDLWLEEPSAVAAEQLAGFGSLTGSIQQMAQYGLANPQNFRVEWDGRPSDLDEEYSMYGYNFLFIWRLAEKLGHDTFWKEWIAGPGTGIPNVEQHAGLTFPAIMMDWALTMAFDHTERLDGYGYDAINLRDGSWENLGTRSLSSSQSGSVRSAGYYSAVGTGVDATIKLQTLYNKAYFVVVRYPRF